MSHILILTKSYFHKTKGQTVSLVALIAIAVMLFNIGFIMQIGISTFFDQRAGELNSGHFAVVVGPAMADASEIEQFLIEHESVIEIEQREVLFSWGDIFVGDHRTSQAIILETDDPTITMNPPSLIGDYLPLVGDVIYIPHFLMVDNGFEIGDSMRLVFQNQEIWFTVGGSTEEIMMGAMGNSGNRFYISDEKFRELQDEFPEAMLPLLTSRLENPEDGSILFNDINNETFTINEEEAGMRFLAMTHEFARLVRTLMPTIIGITIVALAGILLIVCSVVVRFRINSNIEESIKNIGILKATGYENKQIIQSVLLQYGIVTVVGSILGIIATMIFMPFVASVMEGQIGLVWQPSVDLLIGTLTFLGTIGIILLLTYLSTRRIKKLFPLMALRDGITTHNFKKNYFPLEKAKGSLTIMLSFKQVLQSKKQSAMVILIVIGLTFSAVASLTIYYNMVVDNEAFGNTVGGIISDVLVVVEDEEYTEVVRRRLEEMPEVAYLYGRGGGGIRANIDDVNISLTIVEDPSYLGSHMLVEGRFPVHANEIAITPILANMAGFEVGATVMISRDSEFAEFLVTGVVQMMQDLGFFSLMTGEGFRRIEPDFTYVQFHVNLVEDADIDEFIDLIEMRDGDVIRTFNMRSDMEAFFSGMGATVTPVAYGNVIVSGVVIVLILYMIIKTMITRRHKELGIHKALGFTNFQLMNQIALNLLPVIVVGTLIGAIAGHLGFNPIFVAFTRSSGMATADLPTPVNWIVMLVIGLVILSYVTAMLIGRRIRKISAYELVSE